MSLDDDAIVITGGDNDTFPIWVLQDALGIKPGVKVLNLSLLAKEKYRSKVFDELGIPSIRLLKENRQNLDSLTSLQQVIVRQILEKAKNPVYLALTLNTRYYLDQDIQKDLYLSGLVMRYQKKEFDNLGTIRRHFENDYMLDYLIVSFRHDEPSASVVAQMNTGYLPSLVKLFCHYSSSGEREKREKIRRIVAAIAEASGDEVEMKKYINCQ